MSIEITDIYWKNSYLFLEMSGDLPGELVLENSRSGEVFPFTVSPESEGRYTARLNIASVHGSRTLPQGRYVWKAADGENVTVQPTCLRDILSLSRVFRYGDGAYSLNITFECNYEDAGQNVALLMQVEYMRRNRNPFRRRPFAEGKTIKAGVKNAAKYAAAGCLNAYYHFVRLFAHGKQQRILFMSENRDHISENLNAIYLRMKERGITEMYRVETSFRNIFDKKHKGGVRSWLKVVSLMAKCNCIFVDDYTPILNQLNIPKDVTIVQTWHAGFGFKLVGYGRFGFPGSPHAIYSSHRKYTYGIVGCEDLKEIYSEVWGIDANRLIASGIPRLDHFLEEETAENARKRLYSQYPRLKERKYFVFAPTYRGSNQEEAYYDYSKIDFSQLYALCKSENINCVIKMHHFITEEVPVPEEYRDHILEVKGLNINDLYYDAEFLITDYSSCFYDFVLLNKPVLFYVYDLDYYYATRGVHRPLEQVAPGKLCRTFPDLLEAIEKRDFEEEKIQNFFRDRCWEKNGMASDLIIDKILKS